MNDELTATMAFQMDTGYHLLAINDQRIHDDFNEELIDDPYNNWRDHLKYLQANLSVIRELNYPQNLMDVIVRNDSVFDADTCDSNSHLSEIWNNLSKSEHQIIITISKKTGVEYFDHTLN